MICTHGVSTDTPCVKCALANGNGAPFDEEIQPIARLDRRSSSLINEINAPVDPPNGHHMVECAACGFRAGPFTTPDRATLVGGRHMAICEGWCLTPDEANEPSVEVLKERSRCRAIVLELFGSEWSGNKALEWVDSGLTVEQLKEGK